MAEGPADGDAGDAAQRLADVGVGQLAHVLGGDGIDDRAGVLLDGGGALQGGANAGDDDLFQLGRGSGGRFGSLRLGGERRAEQCQRHGGRDGGLLDLHDLFLVWPMESDVGGGCVGPVAYHLKSCRRLLLPTWRTTSVMPL
jgi:hypothetical protein